MRPALIVRTCVVAGLAVALSGCSLKKMAVNSVAGMLSESGATFSSDEDPELVRDAIPFALKLYESLLESVPNNRDLLRATCSVFTQYAYAFVQTDAEILEPDDFETSLAMKDRALKLYLRGQGYCLRALELRRRGVTRALQLAPATALDWARRDDVELLYWTGAAWGAAIAIGQGRPALVADLPAVRALLERALALDETFQNGAIHAAMISIAALPETMGGSAEQARAHFARAVELSNGLDPGPYVTLAASVSVATQNREEFVTLLEQALAIDPNDNPPNRLPALIARHRAERLLARVDELFIGQPGGHEP
ncbi:MAG TPA: TRAP transporter TatT component family protein [Vicinamibacterales bacterium]|nr:TRAP transporter TatT component family protein [Vicinamibacterales bacterium]